MTGRQLLEAGTKRLLTEYREPSELRLELLNLLGELSEQLDLLLQAGKLLDEATQLTVQLHGEDSVRHAQALMAAAEVKTRTSDFDAALAEETRALKTFEQASPQPIELLAQTHILLGNVRDQLQRHDASPTHLETAVALLKTAGSTTDQRSRVSFYLARAFEASRELDRAEAKYLDGIARTEKNFGPRSDIAAFGYENDGDLLRQMSRFDEARRYLQQSLDVYAVVLGPKNLNVSGARYELSQVLSALGERDEDAGPFQTTLGGHQIGIRAGWLMAMGRLVEARGLHTQGARAMAAERSGASAAPAQAGAGIQSTADRGGRRRASARAARRGGSRPSRQAGRRSLCRSGAHHADRAAGRAGTCRR